MDTNNNNIWLWILLLFGVFWLLNNHAHQETLFVVGGHEQHVGMSSDGAEEGEVRAHQPPSQVHHIINKITDTHEKVRGWYEVFENLAVGSEKLLTVVTTLRR